MAAKGAWKGKLIMFVRVRTSIPCGMKDATAEWQVLAKYSLHSLQYRSLGNSYIGLPQCCVQCTGPSVLLHEKNDVGSHGSVLAMKKADSK